MVSPPVHHPYTACAPPTGAERRVNATYRPRTRCNGQEKNTGDTTTSNPVGLSRSSHCAIQIRITLRVWSRLVHAPDRNHVSGRDARVTDHMCLAVGIDGTANQAAQKSVEVAAVQLTHAGKTFAPGARGHGDERCIRRRMRHVEIKGSEGRFVIGLCAGTHMDQNQ